MPQYQIAYREAAKSLLESQIYLCLVQPKSQKNKICHWKFNLGTILEPKGTRFLQKVSQLIHLNGMSINLSWSAEYLWISHFSTTMQLLHLPCPTRPTKKKNKPRISNLLLLDLLARIRSLI